VSGSLYSCGYFRKQSCRFGVVRAVFGIPKRVTSRCLRACSEMFSLFLGGDVSGDWGGVLADLCRLSTGCLCGGLCIYNGCVGLSN